MARSRRTKITAPEKVQVVLAILAGEMTAAEAARRHGVSAISVGQWKARFLESGSKGLEELPAGSTRDGASPEERRMRMENEQLKLALAEATVQLRIWQRGAAAIDQVPSRTSRP